MLPHRRVCSPSHTYIPNTKPFRPYSELLNVWESGADAIRVVRVVVVAVAIVVDIPEVRGVGYIRRPQPPHAVTMKQNITYIKHCLT